MSHTILVADDSVTIQRAIQIAFEKEPYRIVRAMNGDEAVAQARAATPALVLVDHAMPGKSGYEVAEALKSDPATSTIPVVFMSGPSAPFDEARAHQAGIAAHIAKPFDCQTLIEKVGAVLGVAPSAPQVQATPQAAPMSAAAAALPRPPGPQNPFATGTPSAVPAPVTPPVAAAPVAALPAAVPAAVAPASRANPFGLGASEASSGADHEGEEDISFSFEGAKPKAAAPVAAPVAAPAAAPARADVSALASSVVAAAVPAVSAAAPAIAAAVPGDGLDRSAITAATREIIEAVVWEVVPELAETIIREEIARLLRERA